MFEKLLSLLPYNPGLIQQMRFYSQRMREEAAVRRTGLVFLVLAFLIQFFAVISPPVTTAAYSTNDLVDGGISSAADAKSKCDSNLKNYGDIMQTFGITCNEIGNSPTVTLSSTSDNDTLYSFGWLPQGQVNSDTGRKTNETPYSILNSSQDIYGRLLHSWDSGPSSSYQALRIINTQGKVFYILYTCGNLVTIGVPQPIPRCQYDSSILSTSANCFQPCKYNSSIAASSSQCFQPCQYNKSIPASSSSCAPKCQYDSSIYANSPECFQHCSLAGETSLPASSPQCAATCPYNSSIKANNANCFQPCQYNSTISSSSPECVAPCQYNKSIASTSPSCYQPCQYNSGIAASSTLCFPPCQYNASISASDSECKPCEASLSSEDTLSCVTVHKTASNLTTGAADANGTTANPGDVINYTLYAANNGKASVKGYSFQENLSDVLVYANVTDLHGGSIDSNDVVSWPDVTIEPGATATEQVTVTVKNPIPATPSNPSDPSEFDLTMTNVYGNAVNIKVPAPPTVTVQTTAAALPNTGPGAGVIIAAVIVMIGAFFYSRSRLLAVESEIAIHENAGF